MIDTDTTPQRVFAELDPAELFPHPKNIRTDLGDLDDLTESIRAGGIQQPLVVAPAESTAGVPACYEWVIIAGHRRHAAVEGLDLETVPVVIRHDLTAERDQIAAMLAENTQRADLTALEEADAVQGLLDLGDSVKEAAARTGLKEKRVRERSRLAKADDKLRAKITEHGVTLDDALALLAADPEDRAFLEQNLGGHNWRWAKSRAKEKAGYRKAAKKLKAAIADAGLVLYPTWGTARAELDDGQHIGSDVMFRTRVWPPTGRELPDEFVLIDAKIVDSPPEVMVAEVLPVPQSLSSANTDNDATDAAAPAEPEEISEEERAAQQRAADIVTAGRARREFVRETFEQALPGSPKLLGALRYAIRSRVNDWGVSEHALELAGLKDPSPEVRPLFAANKNRVAVLLAAVDDPKATLARLIALLLAVDGGGIDDADLDKERHWPTKESPAEPEDASVQLRWLQFVDDIEYPWSAIERELLPTCITGAIDDAAADADVDGSGE